MVTGRRKLLLADDSITIQKVVSLTFADEGMDVTTAGDGDEAIRLLEENVPDIVLADVFMPRLNGYQVCEHIKGDERFRHIPVMLLVGAFEPFNEAEARRVGADDVLTKPFQSIRNLVNKVGAMLGGGQQADPNADTVDLSPLPPLRETAARAAASSDDATATGSGQHAHVTHDDPSASFADLDMDDELIQATPAEKFGHAREASVAESRLPDSYATGRMSLDDEQHIPLVVMRPEATDTEEPSAAVAPNMEDTLSLFDEEQTPEQRQETHPSMASQEEYSPATEQPEHARAQQPAFAAYGGGGAHADDALLDLGVVESTSSSVAAVADEDDFILDLTDEVSPVTVEREDAPQADYAGAFAEAAHGETAGATHRVMDVEDEMPTVVAEAPVEANFAETWGAPAASSANDASATHDFEISMPPSEFEATEAPPASEFVHASEEWNLDIGGATESATASVADSAADSANDFAGATATAFAVEAGRDDSAAPSLSNAGSQPLTAEQLSPEIIDAIARRAVEQLSEKVVREIAWEVVPQLAELLIKRRLDEEKSRPH